MSGIKGRPQVAGKTAAVVGGGLAGLAVAVRLAEAGVKVELFEARRKLGGRASSFVDPKTGDVVDNCQHVSMGCCTNLADFCRRTGLDAWLRREPTLHFIGPEGQHCRFAGSGWLPAPLHLGPALWGLSFLTWRERWGVARAMAVLAVRAATDDGLSMAEWLKRQGQSERVCERFWSVVLVSALSETLDRISVRHARQVFVDGMMAHRDAYVVETPTVALDVFYGAGLERWLAEHGVRLHFGARGVQASAGLGRKPTIHSGQKPGETASIAYDAVVCAVPWRRCRDAVEVETFAALPQLEHAEQLGSSAITSVHLWFDRPITALRHAVLVGRTSQWLFARPGDAPNGSGSGFYYQVVVSASHALVDEAQDGLIDTVVAELKQVFPAASAATLLHSRAVAERSAVFTPAPGVESLRPAQRTDLPGFYLAGDWTRTGWPATMEGAVRSGYLAAQEVLADFGAPADLLAPNLPTAFLSRCLTRWA